MFQHVPGGGGSPRGAGGGGAAGGGGLGPSHTSEELCGPSGTFPAPAATLYQVWQTPTSQTTPWYGPPRSIYKEYCIRSGSADGIESIHTADDPAEIDMRLARRTATHRRAAQRVRETETVAVDLPIVGHIDLPRPEELAYYLGLTVLASAEIIDWPV